VDLAVAVAVDLAAIQDLLAVVDLKVPMGRLKVGMVGLQFQELHIQGLESLFWPMVR
jgi:hypothetical protein